VIDAQRAARLAHLLTSLARLIEVTDFERRLAEIEAALEQQQAERQCYRAARAALGSAMIMSRLTVTVRPAP
jgi:CBS-domain-containing membrane protein